jgi:hypothetical protein
VSEAASTGAPATSATGLAFGFVQRLTALLLATGLLIAFAVLFQRGAIGVQWPLWLAALVVVEWSAYWVWNSRVTVDHEKIVQTWVWKKTVEKKHISSFNIVEMPFLGWLITPRVVIRTGGMQIITFPVTAPQVLAFVKEHYPFPTGHL